MMRVLDLYEGTRVWFDAKGYACVWRDGKTKKVHVLVWESANGPKPHGHDIHHIDEDKANWTLENLQLLTTTDHQRLHAGWVKDSGGEWISKPCTMCGAIKPLAEFYPRKPTPSARCKPCHAIKCGEWSAKNIEKVRAIKLAAYHRSGRTTRASRSRSI